MEELAWELLGDTRINTADTSQRRLTQAVVTIYLIVTAALTILAPTLMLNLISIAYFFVMQLLPALFGLLFVRQFSAVRLTTGLIAGNAAVLVLHFSQANVSVINIGLIALLLNFLVTFAEAQSRRTIHLPRRWLRPVGRMNGEPKGAPHDG